MTAPLANRQHHLSPSLSMLLFIAAFILHPVHETIAEIEWNNESQRLEVAVRLDAIDDQWIRREFKKPESKQSEFNRTVTQPTDNATNSTASSPTPGRGLRLLPSIGRRQGTRETTSSKTTERSTASLPDNWRLRYAQSHFFLTSGVSDSNEKSEAIRQSRYHWIGIEEDRGHVWWYFEIEPINGRGPKVLENVMLFEKELNQANRVLILGEKPNRTLVHTHKSPRHSIEPDSQDVESN